MDKHIETQPVQAGEAVDEGSMARLVCKIARENGAAIPIAVANAIVASLAPVSAQQSEATVTNYGTIVDKFPELPEPAHELQSQAKTDAYTAAQMFEYGSKCVAFAAAKAPAAQAVDAPSDEQIVQIFNRVQGRWSSFGGPLNAVLKFAREILAASPASTPDAAPEQQDAGLYAAALLAVERVRGFAATCIEDHAKDTYPGQLGLRPQDVATMWAKEIHGIDAKAFLDEAIDDLAAPAAGAPGDSEGEDGQA